MGEGLKGKGVDTFGCRGGSGGRLVVDCVSDRALTILNAIVPRGSFGEFVIPVFIVRGGRRLRI